MINIKNAIYYYNVLGNKSRIRDIKIILAKHIFSGTDTKLLKLGIEPINWQAVDFDDNEWNKALIVQHPEWVLIQNANPIWGNAFNDNEFYLFRHSFFLNEILNPTIMLFNMDDFLKGLYVNGIFVTSNNGSDNYKKIFSIDITSYLLLGKNVISAKIESSRDVGMFQFYIGSQKQNIMERNLKHKDISNNWNGVTL